MDRHYSQSRPYYDYDSEYDTCSSDEEYPRRNHSSTPPASPPLAEPKRGNESMSSWLQRTASSSQAQFAATALVSGAIVAGTILGYQHIRRQERVEDLKSSIPELGRNHKGDKVCLYVVT